MALLPTIVRLVGGLAVSVVEGKFSVNLEGSGRGWMVTILGEEPVWGTRRDNGAAGVVAAGVVATETDPGTRARGKLVAIVVAANTDCPGVWSINSWGEDLAVAISPAGRRGEAAAMLTAGGLAVANWPLKRDTAPVLLVATEGGFPTAGLPCSELRRRMEGLPAGPPPTMSTLSPGLPTPVMKDMTSWHGNASALLALCEGNPSPTSQWYPSRDQSKYVPSQWETLLQCKDRRLSLAGLSLP